MDCRAGHAPADLRPAPRHADVVEDWGDVFPARNRSRFVVDGGVLANTPTRAAVEAIERMPADGPVRRVMLLVYPHAPEPGPDPADALAEPPTLTGALTGVLGALSAQGSRTFVDELEDHNIRAASRRGTRADLLGGFDESRCRRGPEVQQPRAARWRSSSRTTAGCGSGTRPATWPGARCASGRPESWPEQGEVWDYERIRRAAERAQQDVENARRGTPGRPAADTRSRTSPSATRPSPTPTSTTAGTGA